MMTDHRCLGHLCPKHFGRDTNVLTKVFLTDICVGLLPCKTQKLLKNIDFELKLFETAPTITKFS